MPDTKKPWQGRFQEATDAFVEAFTASVTFDQRLADVDIDGSIAHATMLAAVAVITRAECERIVDGLEAIRADISAGQFSWSISLEDVHMNIEAALTERIGDAGKKLHTGRSRNDQIATDIRLYLRGAIDQILIEITRVQAGILRLAAAEAATIMPGFTHLQVAQPITFGHHLLAWGEMLERDYERLQDARKRVNVMPLGAAALAGTTYPIDQAMTANLLGFDRPARNSLDAVSDRDFGIEFSACASMIMMHLSRMAEEMVMWASPLIGFVELPDRYCTGSSIMPQKKNPDVPELVRGKSARVFGHLISLLTLMKGQPLTYNKDNQEDKEPLFDATDTVQQSLLAFADLIPAMVPDRQAMRLATMKGFATATDLADYLVRRHVPFRDAHEIVGKLVARGIELGVDLSDLPLAELTAASEAIEPDVYDVLTLDGSVAARDHTGGTAPAQVARAVREGVARIKARSEYAHLGPEMLPNDAVG
jgi:argininosuccinate lyase